MTAVLVVLVPALALAAAWAYRELRTLDAILRDLAEFHNPDHCPQHPKRTTP